MTKEEKYKHRAGYTCPVENLEGHVCGPYKG